MLLRNFFFFFLFFFLCCSYFKTQLMICHLTGAAGHVGALCLLSIVIIFFVVRVSFSTNPFLVCIKKKKALKKLIKLSAQSICGSISPFRFEPSSKFWTTSWVPVINIRESVINAGRKMGEREKLFKISAASSEAICKFLLKNIFYAIERPLRTFTFLRFYLLLHDVPTARATNLSGSPWGVFRSLSVGQCASNI